MAAFIIQIFKHYLLLKPVHSTGNPPTCLGEGSAYFSPIIANPLSKEEKTDSCRITFLQLMLAIRKQSIRCLAGCCAL